MRRRAGNHNHRPTQRSGTAPLVGIERSEESTLVRLAGELDMANVPLVREVLERECERRPLRLTIDLAAVEFLDVSAMNLLDNIHRRLCAEGSHLMLTDLSEPIAHTMRIAQLHSLLSIAHSTKLTNLSAAG